jgi:antitoxin VapB
MVYTFDIDQQEELMAEAKKEKTEVRAKLFTNGRSQAVRLPKEFRFEGTEVKLRRLHDGVLLEPVEPETKPWETLDEFYSRIDRLRDGHLFPEREAQPLAEERDPIV